MPVRVDKGACIGCGTCTDVCPVEAIALQENGKAECDRDVCVDCGTCTAACPVSAISH